MPVPTAPTFRTSVTYDRQAERFLDTGLRVPVLRQRGVIAAHSAAMIGCALAVLAIPDAVPRPAALVFVALAVLQPILSHLLRHEHTLVAQQLLELTAMAAVALWSPEFWPVLSAWMGAALAWAAISTPRRLHVPISVVSIAAAGAVGWSTHADGWPLAVAAFALVAAAFSVLGLIVRRELWDSESSLVPTLATAGRWCSRPTSTPGRSSRSTATSRASRGGPARSGSRRTCKT